MDSSPANCTRFKTALALFEPDQPVDIKSWLGLRCLTAIVVAIAVASLHCYRRFSDCVLFAHACMGVNFSILKAGQV